MRARVRSTPSLQPRTVVSLAARTACGLRGTVALGHASLCTSPATIAALLEAYPRGAQFLGTTDGAPALLCAALGRATAPALSALLDAWPEGARTPQQDGTIALHAAASLCSGEAVRLLLEAYPEGGACSARG